MGRRGRRSALFCLIDSLNYDSPSPPLASPPLASSLVGWVRLARAFAVPLFFLVYYPFHRFNSNEKNSRREKEEQKHLYVRGDGKRRRRLSSVGGPVGLAGWLWVCNNDDDDDDGGEGAYIRLRNRRCAIHTEPDRNRLYNKSEWGLNLARNSSSSLVFLRLLNGSTSAGIYIYYIRIRIRVNFTLGCVAQRIWDYRRQRQRQKASVAQLYCDGLKERKPPSIHASPELKRFSFSFFFFF